jgi:hypothetical protein
MTGIGALFELYTTWQESRNPKEKDEEDSNLEPEEEEEIILGFFDEESEWHYVIENRDWDGLLDLIQHYDFHKYKPKEPDKKDRLLRVVKAAKWVKEKIRPPLPPELQPVSPLLALNEAGQTPLHLAIINLAPDKYLIRMLFCEKRQALIADQEGHLPLHLSCIHERNQPVIDRCIRSNFEHMQEEDNNGRTPLWYSVERAKELCKEDGYWGIPRSREDAEWQEGQEVVWAKVRFILLSYSTRRKVMIESEREILLVAVEYGAPPAVVEVCVLACQGMLKTDPTLASSALRLFMKQDYPIKNLQLLLHHFPAENVESSEAARRLLSENYHKGNETKPGRKMSFRAEMEKSALEDKFKRSLLCMEWWDKIRCLLRLCGHANNKERKKGFSNKHLLHAALSNSDTPPSLVQLLMVMSPASIRLPHPFNNSLLIHLICRNWKYNLFPQSKGINVISEMEEPAMEQVLKIILASDATLARKRHRDRLPLHHAVATSKSIDFLAALVDADVKTLLARDPQTHLFPFQLAALGGVSRNAALWAHAMYSPFEWKHLNSEERAEAVDEVREEHDREQLSTIFFLLRKSPMALTSGALLRKPAVFRDTQGKGMVSAHYLAVVYSKDIDGNYVLQEEILAALQVAINTGEMPEELDHWWQKLKFWIRFCYDGDEKLPHGEDYLLHAAVASSDTPPMVIQLLLALFPESVSLPVNGEVTYPLHIAAATPFYKPQHYEVVETPDVFEMLVRANPEAASVHSALGSPIDIAHAHGKSDDEVLPLLEGFIEKVMAEMEKHKIDLTEADMTKPDLDTTSQGELSEMTETTPSTQSITISTSTRSERP